MRLKEIEISTYDLLSYFLPGIVVMGELLIFFTGVENTLQIVENLSGFKLFLILSGVYMLGHLIQSISNILDSMFQKIPVLNKIITRLPTYNFFSDKNNKFSREFKEKILQLAKRVFNLNQANEREIFNLCYSLVLQKVEKTRLDLFVAIYGFYRGLSYACLIGIILFLIRLNFPLITLFLISWVLLLQRYKRFKNYFEEYVYRDFYIYYLTQKNEP